MAVLVYNVPIGLEHLTPRLRQRAIAGGDAIATWSEREKRYTCDHGLLILWLAGIRWTEQGSPDAADVEELAKRCGI